MAISIKANTKEMWALGNKGYVNYGEHYGDVFFSKDAIPPIMPSVGQIGSMLCPRRACQHAVWNDMDYCPFCHYNLKQYRQSRDLQYKISELETLSWRAGLVLTISFFTAPICFFLLNPSQGSLQLIAILSFIICFIAMQIKKNVDAKAHEYTEELKRLKV